MSQLESHQLLDIPQRRYDSNSDRLFLVYYALPPGFNANKWGVSESSIERNIHSAVNKPVVVYKKNPNNPWHSHQAGSYVHPTPDEARSELGKINAEQYYNWQEKFAIGRVRSVDKRDRGYAFTLEITDNDAKQILKSPEYKDGIPGYTSPQILSNYGAHPEQERTNEFEHWQISHIALVDVPAYGKEQAGLRAHCLGAEKECMITTRSASQENLGFCIKQAAIDLIESRSSQSSPNATANNITMSESPNTNQQTVSGQTVTYNPQTVTTTDVTQPLNKVSAAEQQSQPESTNPENEKQPEKEETEHLTTSQPKDLQEAQAMVRQMSELLKEQGKQLKNQGKELETIRTERKQARLSYIIPRDLFKSDESHAKEVQKTMNENISEQWLVEYWKTKRELFMAQTNRKMEEPLVAKSASSVQQGHDVPDFSSSQNTVQTSNVQKQLELQRRILEGGAV